MKMAEIKDNLGNETVDVINQKMNLGTFCKLVSVENADGNKVYNMEDAYGNVKGFSEEQLTLQIKLGVLNAVNVEISKNNKIVRRKSSVLEINYDNINTIKFFPCLVKVFDLTTENEGTAVAVGYKNLDLEDKYKTIINVVINGNMYEASYKSIRSQGKTCRKNTCLNCMERDSRKCRFNRYGGGWKLCIKIHSRYQNVRYQTCESDSELLAVAADNGKLVAFLTEKYGKRAWQYFKDENGVSYQSAYKFKNAFFWGETLEYDVPTIDWNTFNHNRLLRIDELENLILEMCWKVANEGTIDLLLDERMICTYSEQWETDQCFSLVWEEYAELNMDENDILEDVEDFLKNKCLQNNMKLYYLNEGDYRVIYAVDLEEGFRARKELQKIIKDEVDMLVNECEQTEDMINNFLQTNIWDYDCTEE